MCIRDSDDHGASHTSRRKRFAQQHERERRSEHRLACEQQRHGGGRQLRQRHVLQHEGEAGAEQRQKGDSAPGYGLHGRHVHGLSLIHILQNFADLGLSEAALAAVERLGYENPTPVQLQAIPLVLEGRDLIAAASTGTGKTCLLYTSR